MSINKVIITGNLTREPELRTTQSGTAVLSLGVAVNERIKNNQTGEWEDRPNFIDCTMFGTRAESVNRFIHKGSKVAIEGRLRWSQWEHEGQKRSKIEVLVGNIEFMSKSEQNAPQQAYQQQVTNQQPQAYQAQQTYQQQPQQAYQQPQQQAMEVPPQPQQYTSIYDADIPF